MEIVKKAQFTELMKKISNVYNYDNLSDRMIIKLLVGLYWHSLKKYLIQDIESAFLGYMHDTDRSCIRPTNDQIIDRIQARSFT